MKINDLVKVTRGDNVSKLGKILLIRNHDLSYTKFVLAHVEFDDGLTEWINVVYLVKV